MAERDAMQRLYAYQEMSNKVQQADRRGLRPRQGEATGEVESLRGRGDVGRMGDRIVGGVGEGEKSKRDRPAEITEKMEKAAKKRARREAQLHGGGGADAAGKGKGGSKTGGGGESFLSGTGGQTILDMGDLTGYQPTNASSRAAYESLLNLLGQRRYLGDQPTSVLRDALTEIVASLKDGGLRDPDRHDAVSRLLTGKGPNAKGGGGVSSEQFAQFVRLGKGLDDYDDYANRSSSGGAQTTTEKKGVDDEMGVAVVFDSDEEGEEEDAAAAGPGGVGGEGSDVDEDEVVEVAESSSEEEDSDAEGPERPAAAGDDADTESEDDHVVLRGGEKSTTKASTSGSGKADRVLSVHEIDAHYLQRLLSSRGFNDGDADACAGIADEALGVLDPKAERDLRECENRLLVLLGFDMFDAIKLVLTNRVRIWGVVSLKRARNDAERDEVEALLKGEKTGEGMRVWEELHSKSRAEDWSKERMRGMAETLKGAKKGKDGDVSKALDSIGIKSEGGGDGTKMDVDTVKEEAIELDLDSLAFQDGSHTMSNKKCDLPDKSWRAMKKGYEEVHVPAVKSVVPADEKVIPIPDLPKWTHDAFKGMERLNRVQSKMCDVALRSSENILLCAPTGAGKTNVAMLAMLNILGQYRKKRVDEDGKETMDDDDGLNDEDRYDLASFKIVYVAPMKALVQEVVKNFSKRLSAYGVSVRELSGDSSLTRQQISETQLLVTTPEKWDIVTRQGEGRAYTQLVRLVIVDEIHLLHDDRGPVLESIVSRVVRQVETTSEPVRLVGLSATLPNYGDVAAFLRVKPDKGLFFFDHSYRPVPLQMQYIGVTERNAFKRFRIQNEICYDKALVQRRGGNQMLIFVHSRKETGKTAAALRDMALERDELSHFVREGGSTQEILREELSSVKNPDLKEVLPYGLAIHHAGMCRTDRELVEDLFADGHIAVLCCTATLAWGVNLPAHAVIIKGTQIYDPSKGRWAELSPLDVLQMLGRAGRPQYDTEGEGIIVTAHSELQYYLSLTNLQLPVESQLIKTLADHLNAEVVLGTVQSIREAVDWLGYSFLYVRMLQNPALYGIHNPEQTLKEDPTLRRRRLDLAHSAACLLEKSHLLRYDRRSGSLQSTPLGRIASQYYITHGSMALYGRHLRPNMTDIELLRLFSLSGEFSHVTVREEEKLELTKLAARVPIPVKESPSEPSAKINVLLQAYVSRLRLDGFALVSDMAFVQQSAARIMRALFEIALRRNWAGLTRLTLAFSNMVQHRIWRSQSPLRQFPNVPEIVARKLERKSDIEWGRYPDLTPSDLGELVGVPKMGRTLHKLVHQFPRLEVSAHVQPITRSMLRVDLTLLPDFQFDVKVHGYVQLFHVLVEDVNGSAILHHEMFALKSTSAEEEHSMVFTVPILDPLPPSYFVRVLSDRWLHSEAVLPISFGNMILPPKFPPPTELLDLQPLPPAALGEAALVKLYQNTGLKEFNPIQTQTFHELFKTDRNALICAASGSGKTACAEFAVLRMLVTDPNGKAVYVAPREEVARAVFEDWSKRLGSILRGAGKVAMLSGETAPDLKTLGEAKIAVCTVRQWDALSRRWRQRKAVRDVTLFIADEVHFLGGDLGPTLEVVVSRMRYIGSQRGTEGKKGAAAAVSGSSRPLRIVGLSAPIANAREIGEWMGVPTKSLFNFSPRVRPAPLEIFFQSFDQAAFSARLMAMAKPAYGAVMRHAAEAEKGGGGKKPSIVFVPSRRQAQLTAIDLMTYRESVDAGATFLGENADEKDVAAEAEKSLREPALRQVVAAGIGFVHSGMLDSEWDVISRLYRTGALTVLVCPADLCWKLRETAHLVVVMGTESYDGRERRYVDYPLADLLHMMGRASRQPPLDTSGTCAVFCHGPKKDRLKKLLYDPLPVESHLDHYLHDHFNSEIVTKTIGSMQDAVDYVTWTFLYRRLTRNPNYYGLRGTDNVHLSEHLSEMVETVLGDLEESKCCRMTDDGDAVTPLNLGMIAAYYYVQYQTVELVASSVTAKTKTRGVMEILSAASEFSTLLSIRHGEERALKVLARALPHKLPESAHYHDPNTKALVLLQCHFGRKSVSSDLRNDQQLVLGESVNLIQAIVDVISSNGWLKPALAAMELSQMVVQGLWNKDHVLLQIPHFTKEIVERCEAHKGEEPIESVFDILTLEDDVRNDLLRLPDDAMADVAFFCNGYPNIDVSFDVRDAEDVTAGDPVQIVVKLEREIDEDSDDEDEDNEGGGDKKLDEEELDKLGIVSAPLFPKEKREGWWIVVGDTKTNSLLSLKRVGLRQKQTVKLEFMAPEEAGDYDLTLFCMSDSYLGCDQEYAVPLSVAVGEESDDSEESKGGDSSSGDEE